MDRRTRILAIVFGMAIAYVVVERTVYSSWIKPLLTIDRRIAEKKEKLGELEAEANIVKAFKQDYRGWLDRAGTFDANKAELDLGDRLVRLIAKHQIKDSKLSSPLLQLDPKTGVHTSRREVNGETTLSSAIEFTREAAELPQVCRTSSFNIRPTSSGLRERGSERVNITLKLESKIFPQQPKLLGIVDESKLTKPESLVRHHGRDYSRIWKREPFTEYEKLIPLTASTRQPHVSVNVNQNATLQMTTTGGNGRLKYQWLPPEGLNNPTVLNPSVETSTPRTQTYTLTVTDQREQTATAIVNVTVKEVVVAKPPEPVRQTPPPPPPPPPPPDPRWVNRRELQLTVYASREDNARWVDQLLVYDSRAKSSKFYQVGDLLDGGELVHAAARGAVVKREGEYWVYPLGMGLDTTMLAQDIKDQYPDLFEAAKKHRETSTPPAPPPNAGTADAAMPVQAQRTGFGGGGESQPMTGLAEWVGPPLLPEGAGVEVPAVPLAPANPDPLPTDPAVAKPPTDLDGTKVGEQPSVTKQRPRRPARTGGARTNQPPKTGNPAAGDVQGGNANEQPKPEAPGAP